MSPAVIQSIPVNTGDDDGVYMYLLGHASNSMTESKKFTVKVRKYIHILKCVLVSSV